MLELKQTVCEITGSPTCQLGEVIQSLWSGYGVIQRVHLDHQAYPTAIVKHIDLSQSRQNRRGWSGDVSHQRKVKSYEVEKTFYETYAGKAISPIDVNNVAHAEFCLESRVPKMLGAHEKPDSAGWLIILEDLDGAGFNLRSSSQESSAESILHRCLKWLANFHAKFMQCEPVGLWEIGTYWHLATRQEEWRAMEEGPLKRFSSEIDQRLNRAKFQTLVHGDAKLANFCFASTVDNQAGGLGVAAVDFQYVGGGCGMKDVAYLVSSCLDGTESKSQQDALLDVYFRQLENALAATQPRLNFEALESEWRGLYPCAWADFCRFLAGWSPGHWKLNEYNDKLTQSVLGQFQDK